MNDGVTIASLEIENVKKVKAVRLVPTETGLTLIGGDNGQGKTSVIESIMGCLGGDSFRQSVREGAERGTVEIKLSNGVLVKRIYTASGGSRLEVIDADGKKGGQQLLSAFVSAFALDVTQFMDTSDKKKADILLKVIGVDPTPFEDKIKVMESERLLKGRERDRAKGNAESLPFFEGYDEKLDGNSISAQMTAALSHNARVRQAVGDVDTAKDRAEFMAMKEAQAEQAVTNAIAARDEATKNRQRAEVALADIREKAASAGQPVDTQAISAKLQEVTEHNEKVSANLARSAALDLFAQLAADYKSISCEIENLRGELRSLLEGADLPYPGLGVNEGVLEYNGRPWVTLSESERLILATAVSRAVMPQCKFVLIDGMERMDKKTLRTFTGWLVAQGLQAIGTRVGDGSENTIIIEDGEVVGANEEPSFD